MRADRGYPDGMATTPANTVTTEPIRFSIRLPHWGYCFGATLGLVALAAGLSV